MKLPTRKKQAKKPTSLPAEFLKNVSALFKKEFSKQIKGAEFLVYGSLYVDEVVFCVSLAHAESLRAASMHISADLPKNVAENPEKVTEQLKVMVDIAASWFAQSLQAGDGLESVLEEMQDMDPSWQALDWEGSAVHVKLNKDNYALEKAADDWLKKSGYEEGGEDILDSEDDDEGSSLH